MHFGKVVYHWCPLPLFLIIQNCLKMTLVQCHVNLVHTYYVMLWSLWKWGWELLSDFFLFLFYFSDEFFAQWEHVSGYTVSGAYSQPIRGHLSCVCVCIWDLLTCGLVFSQMSCGRKIINSVGVIDNTHTADTSHTLQTCYVSWPQWTTCSVSNGTFSSLHLWMIDWPSCSISLPLSFSQILQLTLHRRLSPNEVFYQFEFDREQTGNESVPFTALNDYVCGGLALLWWKCTSLT